jgi:nicotinamide mononucleotide transporter
VTAFCAWLVAHHSSCLELVAVLFGIAGVYLSILESIWNWPVGMVNVALFSVLFWKQHLYANSGLQVVYFALSVYGWYQWLHGGAQRGELRVARTSPRTTAGVSVAIVLSWAALFFLVRRLPGASFTFTDTATTAVSLVAEWMLARKLFENWILWTAIDGVYVVMLVAGGLYLTAVNYAIYVALAIYGWISWRRILRAQTA